MKRLFLLCAATSSILAAYGCSQGAPPGASSTGTGGMVASPSGGSLASGGTTAGMSANSGGTVASGGTVFAGGAGASSGSSSGGSVASSGGSSPGGASALGGSAQTSGGAGAVMSSGGTPGGAAGALGGGGGASGGSAGAQAGGGGMPAAGSGGGGGLSAADIVPGLNGFYWEGTCVGTRVPGGHNCPLDDKGSSCPSGGITRDKTIDVKGTAGQLYTINIEVRGVVGTRCYQNGKRASAAAPNENGDNNWWYIGGTPYNATGWWNTYELHVSPSTGDASGDVYYFNGADNPSGNFCEREASYLVKYTASFKAKGGGTLTFRLHDQNCQAQQNCGSNTDSGSTCAPRNVDLTGMAAQPPANFTQPPTNMAGSMTYRPQWILIAVTSVTSP